MSQSAPLTADWGYLSEHESGTDGLPASGVDELVDEEYPREQALDSTVPEHLRLQVQAWPTDHRCSLDRLTVVGVLPQDELPAFERWLAECWFVDSRRAADLPYKWQHTLLDRSGLLQYGDARSSVVWGGSSIRLRYDWNPAHVPVDRALEVLAWFTERRLTRVDVALDYPRDLSRCSFDRERCSRSAHWGADGALETVYLGAAGSKLRYRCYNKARERDFAGQYVPDGLPWWRIEAVWRPQPGDEPFPESLFDALTVAEPMDTVTGSWRDLGALLWAHDHPEYVRRLHWRVRRKIADGLDALRLPLLPSPVCSYRLAHRPRLLAELGQYVDLCRSEH